MNNGVILFNAGTKCLPRLLTCVHSLRKNYSGPACIVSMGEESLDRCSLICEEYKVDLVDVKEHLDGYHYYWFEKARMHLYTPYERSIFIDSDMIILKDFSELFEEIEKHDFIVPKFSNWTCGGRTISARISQFKNVDPVGVVKTIMKNGPSINVGLYGFDRNSELMANWFDYTIPNPKANLPEESSCHILINKYKSHIISNAYNCSCKHDDPRNEDVKVVHFHGRKHCRLNPDLSPKFNCDIWIKNWHEVYSNNIADVKSWATNCGDTQLDKFIKLKNYERYAERYLNAK